MEKLPDWMTIFCYFNIHFTLDQIYDEFMAILFFGLWFWLSIFGLAISINFFNISLRNSVKPRFLIHILLHTIRVRVKFISSRLASSFIQFFCEFNFTFSQLSHNKNVGIFLRFVVFGQQTHHNHFKSKLFTHNPYFRINV